MNTAVEKTNPMKEALDKCVNFIENVTDDDPNRQDLFFEARQAWRQAYDEFYKNERVATIQSVLNETKALPGPFAFRECNDGNSVEIVIDDERWNTPDGKWVVANVWNAHAKMEDPSLRAQCLATAALFRDAHKTASERDKLKEVLELVLKTLEPHYHKLGVKKAYSEIVTIAQTRKLLHAMEEGQSIEKLNKII